MAPLPRSHGNCTEANARILRDFGPEFLADLHKHAGGVQSPVRLGDGWHKRPTTQAAWLEDASDQLGDGWVSGDDL